MTPRNYGTQSRRYEKKNKKERTEKQQSIFSFRISRLRILPWLQNSEFSLPINYEQRSVLDYTNLIVEVPPIKKNFSSETADFLKRGGGTYDIFSQMF